MDHELIVRIGTARYEIKRKAGISNTRSDGSRCSVYNDINAAGAECFAAEQYNQPFNESITKTGDGGSDFSVKINGQTKTVEVIWLGFDYKNNVPRTTGHLIVNPHEPQRWANLYLVIKGSLKRGYTEAGWATHEQLTKASQKDFGYGRRFAIHVNDLNSPNELQKLIQGT